MQDTYGVTPRSWYIHWPFCPYKCHFCPFVAFAGQDHHMVEYHKSLLIEIEQELDQNPYVEPLNTLYFGGGTPSTYPTDLLLDITGILNIKKLLHKDTEFTLEINPGTVTPEKVRVWAECGINRASIGVQSLNTRVLNSLNRHQTNEDVSNAVSLTSQYIRSVSVDLIVGLPGVDRTEWESMVNQVITWPIHHISIYFLMVHEGTFLYHRVAKNRINLPCDEIVCDMYLWTVEQLKDAGFKQYEVSNFARPGHESKHNRAYWNRERYKGFGVGAWSFDGLSRAYNQKDLKKYMDTLAKHEDVTVFSETLTQEQVKLEQIMLGLRCVEGIAFSVVTDGLTEEHRVKILDVFDNLEQADLVTMHNNRLMLTPSGLAVEHDIATRLVGCW